MHPLMQMSLTHSVGDASLAISQGLNVSKWNPSIAGHCRVPMVLGKVSYLVYGGTGVVSTVMF